ncbi:MAG: hypothetical protein KAI25_16430 [Hyphomicrobiaceae bacterium]|nr:hypothetical protein [Hyphomicrobiaceae bacterium]
MTGVDVKYGEYSLSQIGDRIEEIIKKYCPENTDQIVPEVIDELLGAVAESFSLKSIDLELRNLIIVSDNTPKGTSIMLGEERRRISNIRSMQWSIEADEMGTLRIELV